MADSLVKARQGQKDKSRPEALRYPSVAEALRNARSQADEEDLVVVTGSILWWVKCCEGDFLG